MQLKQLFFKIIYQPQVNYFLRNINYFFKPLFPKIQIPPSGILSLKTDSGRIKLYTNQTSYLTQILFWKGYKEFEYSEIFEELSKKITTFFDIGANIGYYALLAARTNPTIKTYAFEPAFGPKYFLKKNIESNEFNNIKAIDFALSNENSEIDFYEVKSKKYNYLKHNLSGENNAGTKTKSRNFILNKVNSITLENFIKNENITSIDLIKIDTEGTEVVILESGEKFIKKFTPIVICETLFNTTEKELTGFFNNLDYLFYNHTKEGLVKVSTIIRAIDNGVRNCFFVPKNKEYLIKPFLAKENII